MTGVRYKIPMLSAKAILAYAKPVGEDVYSFNLNKAETSSVLLNHGDTYQDDNAVFYQLMSMLHRDGYSPEDDEMIIDDLYDAIIYLDFAGIFDRSADYPKNALTDDIILSSKSTNSTLCRKGWMKNGYNKNLGHKRQT